MEFPYGNNSAQYARAAASGLDHRLSRMSACQVQDYMALLIEKHEALGEPYVARQLAWAEVELDRVGGAA
jgi:hypothetical protein